MDKFFREPFTFDRTVRLVIFTILAGCFVLGVIAIWEVLLPFLLAGIFAYVMMPLVRFLQYKVGLRSRGLSVGVVFILLMLSLSLGVNYIIPAVQDEIAKTSQALSTYGAGESLLQRLLPPRYAEVIEVAIGRLSSNEQLDVDRAIEGAQAILGQMGSIMTSTLSVFSWGMVFLVGLIYFVFIMLDFEGLTQGVVRLTPRGIRQPIHTILKELDFYMNNYFRGQSLVALSVGVLLSIGFNIIGLPMATALGIFIGLLNFIPYMQALGILPLILCSLLMSAQTGQSPLVSLLLGFGVLMIVQILQDGVIVPRIMGQSLGMRPSLILLALSVWGSLLGFFGLLIALPITMTLYSVYMRYVLEDGEHVQDTDAKVEAWRQRNAYASKPRGRKKGNQPEGQADEQTTKDE